MARWQQWEAARGEEEGLPLAMDPRKRDCSIVAAFSSCCLCFARARNCRSNTPVVSVVTIWSAGGSQSCVGTYKAAFKSALVTKVRADCELLGPAGSHLCFGRLASTRERAPLLLQAAILRSRS